MKHLLLVIAVTTLTFTSCTRETIVNEPIDENSSLLESFEIKRNLDGTYALTHEISDGISADYSETKEQNEIYLYSDESSSKSNNQINYNVTDNKLNVTFIDENNSKLPRIRITDDNTFDKSGELGLLETYTLVYNQDGTVKVDFTVEEGVQVAFGYNNTEDINDIYLTQGESSIVNYSKSYTKEADTNLRIDFVQNTSKDSETKKPRVIIE
jgi:hypothetical protein